MRCSTRPPPAPLVEAVARFGGAEMHGNADDRRYFGEALRFAFGDWKRRYLSDAIIEEGAGEEARAAFMIGLVLESANIASTLRALAESFAAWSVATKDVGASRVRRLVRVAAALKTSIVELDPPPGDDLGQALLSFGRAALGGEQINDRDLQVQTSAAFLDLLSPTSVGPALDMTRPLSHCCRVETYLN